VIHPAQNTGKLAMLTDPIMFGAQKAIQEVFDQVVLYKCCPNSWKKQTEEFDNS
jgi:hypothetical protein